MNILIFSPDEALLNMISFALESRLGPGAKTVSKVERAFELLLAEDAIDLLVLADVATTPLFVKYLASLGAKIPVILVDPNRSRGAAGYPGINIAAQLSVETLLQDLPALIQANYQSRPQPIESDFCRISVELLLKVGPLQDDVYVRLSSVKFVKLFNADAEFTERELARVWGVKKIDYLWIRREATPAFVRRLQAELTAMMRKVREGDDGMLATVSRVQETIQGLAERTGITEEIVKLTRAHVDFALKVIGKAPQLKRVIATVMGGHDGYVASHSVQVAHMACCLASELRWPSNLTFQKLIFAAFIHDLQLLNPEQAMVSTRAELDRLKTSLSAEEVLRIETHAAQAAEIVNRFPQVPSDVYQIILQHHERAGGDGFPRGLTASKIAPLAAVFIVAHEIVDELIARGNDFDLAAFWASRADVYGAGTFKEIARVGLNVKRDAA